MKTPPHVIKQASQRETAYVLCSTTKLRRTRHSRPPHQILLSGEATAPLWLQRGKSLAPRTNRIVSTRCTHSTYKTRAYPPLLGCCRRLERRSLWVALKTKRNLWCIILVLFPGEAKAPSFSARNTSALSWWTHPSCQKNSSSALVWLVSLHAHPVKTDFRHPSDARKTSLRTDGRCLMTPMRSECVLRSSSSESVRGPMSLK